MNEKIKDEDNRKSFISFFFFRMNLFRPSLTLQLSTKLQTNEQTSWKKIHLEKLTVAQIVKNFPVLYGTQ
jgi:hypothetical protein